MREHMARQDELLDRRQEKCQIALKPPTNVTNSPRTVPWAATTTRRFGKRPIDSFRMSGSWFGRDASVVVSGGFTLLPDAGG